MFFRRTRSERQTPLKICMYHVLRFIPPWLRIYKPAILRSVEGALRTIQIECRKLLAEKKLEAASTGLIKSKDLISILLEANTAKGGKEVLSDEEVIGQVSVHSFSDAVTFIFRKPFLLQVLKLDEKSNPISR